MATEVEFNPCKATLIGMECGEGIGETGCVGGVKGSHRIKVREALDLVTFLTGLLNSRLENPKDTLNS